MNKLLSRGAAPLLALAFSFFFFICPAKAQSGKVGLGIIVGDPTGISFKAWMNEQNAIDAAAAWSFRGRGYFLIHASYLRHADVFPINKGRLPLYYGIGARVIVRENHPRFRDDPRIGVRIPLGITYIFSGSPFDIFLEVAPLLDLVPATTFDFNGAIGGRFYF
jgi:hypothetical protein